MIEMIKNGGFETVLNSLPQYWEKYATGTTHIYTFPDIGKTGNAVGTTYPVREVDKSASWRQTIPVMSSTNYKVSGWMKTENVTPAPSGITGANMRIDWKDANWVWKSNVVIMTRVVINTDWTLYTADVISDPAAAYGEMFLDLKNCAGKATFDDISFLGPECPDPQSVLTIT